MLLTFRSYKRTPYVYDPRTNKIYNIDEKVYKAIEKAGGIVANIKDEDIRKGCADMGITDATLPLQTPQELKQEITGMNIGFQKLVRGHQLFERQWSDLLQRFRLQQFVRCSQLSFFEKAVHGHQ